MNLNKHLEFFNPISDIKKPIHIIGCGAVGSTIAEMLTRMGVEKLNIYDFDIVTAHNLANQMFDYGDITEKKELALRDICQDINPDIEIKNHGAYTDQHLAGYIFLAVDNIELRKKICTDNKANSSIKAVFDFRMRLTDAQHYAADWSNSKQVDNLINTMQFSREEAQESTPTSACGTSLNIVPTVRMVVSLGLANFINFIKKKELKIMILMDAFNFTIDAFSLAQGAYQE